MSTESIPLGELVEIVGGGTPSRNVTEFWNGGIPWATVKDMTGAELSETQEFISEKGVSTSATRIVPAGSVIMATRMGLGKVAINKVDLAINQDLKALKCNSNLDPKFLLYFLQSKAGYLESQGKGATVKGIKLDLVRSLLVPRLSLTEQRRIATILDKADAIRRKRRQAIDLMNAFLRSVFLEMFGDPTTNSKDWPIYYLEQLGELNRGKSKHRPRNAPELLGGPYPFIQTGDVANCNGYIKEYKSTYSELGLSQSKMWAKATLCITIAANIAKTGILEFDACFPDSIVGFTPSKRTSSEFIQCWFSFFQKSIEDSAPQSAQKNINLEILRKLQVALPPIELQNKFNVACKAVEVLRTRLIASEREADALMQSLANSLFSSDGEQRQDRRAIDKFVKFYVEQSSIDFTLISYPEEDAETAEDARIDAIYGSKFLNIYIEHTSVDLIVSGNRNKRSLDPAFTAIESSLQEAKLPSHQGLYIHFPLEAAKDVARVKSGIPELLNKIKQYLVDTDASEWRKYPRKADSISANGINFGIKPDYLCRGKIWLTWSASEDNFLEADQLESKIERLISSKLDKLDRSAKSSNGPIATLLLVETNDVAARSFHHFAGVFARILNRHRSPCTEVWGVHGDSRPTLIWCSDLDSGITRCVYSEDPASRTFYEIEKAREFEWRKIRSKALNFHNAVKAKFI